MNTQIITITLLAIVISFVGIQAYQINALKNPIAGITGNAVSTAAGNTGAIDMTGWTENEKMNYEMHGVIPSKAANSRSSSQGTAGTGMVGGC